MAQTVASEELVKALNDLIHLDHDAARAYQEAIDRLSDGEAKSRLTEFRKDHLRHVELLEKAVRSLGAEPAKGGDLRQVLTQGMVVLRSIQGDTGILKAMKSNEDQTNAAYEKAVVRSDLTPDIRRMLEANLNDERRHRAWIEARIARRP